MYIRRKVFSVIRDENGDERLFSTTDVVTLDERFYSQHPITGETITPAEYRKVMKQLGKANGGYSLKDIKGMTSEERGILLDDAIKEQAAKSRKEIEKKLARKEAGHAAQDIIKDAVMKEREKYESKKLSSRIKNLGDKIGKGLTDIYGKGAKHRGRNIALTAAGVAALGAGGYGAYKLAKNRKEKKEEEA